MRGSGRSAHLHRACVNCPYRRDVPSGGWGQEEYDKLRAYDAETPFQSTRVFQCHQADRDSEARRICSGWAGCHEAEHLLSVRLVLTVGT